MVSRDGQCFHDGFLYIQKSVKMIVWDEPKRQQNLAKHGLDFADLDEWFFLEAMTVPAKDDRHMTIGRLADGIIVVVYAFLGTEGFR